MQKLVSLLFVFIITITAACAENIDKTLTRLGINKSAVSIMIKNIENGNVVYSLNERTPMHPASTLKLVTSSVAIDALGYDYKYKTSLYKSTNNDLYLKLSGDPFLTSDNLETLVKAAKAKDIIPKTFYIDDTAFDKSEWGEGWQWDDALNPLMPKYSIYNLNKNMLRIDITPTTKGSPASLVVKPGYPLTLMNYVVTNFSQGNNVGVSKNAEIANIIDVAGSVSKNASVKIPLQNPKLNFKLRLEDVFNDSKFEYFSKIQTAELPAKDVYLVEEVEHDVLPMLALILKSSDNMTAETLFKTAGAVWAEAQGSFANSQKMFEAYLNRKGINYEDIKVVDGSGVSKNNLMTAEFMTDFLVFKSKQENFETFKNLLPTPSEGTLKNRMLYFKDNLRAKTGTLADTSAIAGYLTTKRGRTYAFDIMINDAKTSAADKKNIEEQVLRELFMNY